VTFTDHLLRLATKALAGIPAAEAHDIYAISFWVDNEHDDPRQPILTIGYNTEAQVGRILHDAADPAEARWNFAFWLQNELVVIGDSSSDPAGAAMRDEWIRHLGLCYDDPCRRFHLGDSSRAARRPDRDQVQPSLLPARPNPPHERCHHKVSRPTRAGARP
jgi:hypothetical protein